MFQELVAEHYTKKGYKVHQARKVRGKSGNVYLVDMVCVGDIGHLVISFGDEGGIEGPELGAVKRIAQDIGAAPVAAVPDPTPAIRRMANQAGVAIVDQEALLRPDSEPDLRSEEQIAHPWPRSGESRDDPAGLWSKVREAPRSSESFGWLNAGKDSKPSQSGSAPTAAAKPAPARAAPQVALQTSPTIQYEPEAVHAPVRQVVAPTARAPPSGFDPKTLIGPALYGAVTALVLFLFWLLFG
ncbi:MAG: hypothetical protein ACPHK8_06370 [Thermoplasmatota archaeon]